MVRFANRTGLEVALLNLRFIWFRPRLRRQAHFLIQLFLPSFRHRSQRVESSEPKSALHPPS
jgi:hypothetical protein